MENRLCVIGVYFGKLPPYFELWLKTCRYNKTVDFLIFTDQYFVSTQDNVKVISLTLEDFRSLACEKLKMDVTLDRAYKCCDFRPAYGIILQDYIRGYDYWGHCDFDMMFGDLQHFFDKENLYAYDKFLTLGHLSLYRNTTECNGRFMLEGSEKNYEEIFTSPGSYAFDEVDGILKIYKKNGFPVFEERIFADISKIYRRLRLALDDKNYDDQVFYWEKGKVYRAFLDQNRIKTEEFIYIHFKKREFGKQPFDEAKAESFYLTTEGFVEKTAGIPTLEDIRRYNKFKGSMHERQELAGFNFDERYQRLKNKFSQKK